MKRVKFEDTNNNVVNHANINTISIHIANHSSSNSSNSSSSSVDTTRHILVANLPSNVLITILTHSWTSQTHPKLVSVCKSFHTWILDERFFKKVYMFSIPTLIISTVSELKSLIPGVPCLKYLIYIAKHIDILRERIFWLFERELATKRTTEVIGNTITSDMVILCYLHYYHELVLDRVQESQVLSAYMDLGILLSLPASYEISRISALARITKLCNYLKHDNKLILPLNISWYILSKHKSAWLDNNVVVNDDCPILYHNDVITLLRDTTNLDCTSTETCSKLKYACNIYGCIVSVFRIINCSNTPMRSFYEMMARINATVVNSTTMPSKEVIEWLNSWINSDNEHSTQLLHITQNYLLKMGLVKCFKWGIRPTLPIIAHCKTLIDAIRFADIAVVDMVRPSKLLEVLKRHPGWKTRTRYDVSVLLDVMFVKKQWNDSNTMLDELDSLFVDVMPLKTAAASKFTKMNNLFLVYMIGKRPMYIDIDCEYIEMLIRMNNVTIYNIGIVMEKWKESIGNFKVSHSILATRCVSMIKNCRRIVSCDLPLYRILDILLDYVMVPLFKLRCSCCFSSYMDKLWEGIRLL